MCNKNEKLVYAGTTRLAGTPLALVEGHFDRTAVALVGDRQEGAAPLL
jgi:hypothetical protein